MFPKLLFDRVVIHTPKKIVKEIINNPNNGITMLYFPDAGASKRYKDEIDVRPYLYGEKDRDWATGQIKGVIVCNPMNIADNLLKGAHVLIVDDICSKGGTFYHGANALKELGVGQIDLFVTHCEDSIFNGELLKEDSPVTKIFTTNSFFRGSDKKIIIINYMEAM